MEAIGMLLSIAFVVFIFGLYADSGRKRDKVVHNDEPMISYGMQPKGR